jgi:hypothetical protein
MILLMANENQKIQNILLSEGSDIEIWAKEFESIASKW